MLCSHEEQQQTNTNLFVDYPFSFSLKESSGASKASVPVSEADDYDIRNEEDDYRHWQEIIVITTDCLFQIHMSEHN